MKNEEKLIRLKLHDFYDYECQTEARLSIWKLMFREFRRFLLDFAEKKKQQNTSELNTRFKKAGGFQEK